MAIKHLPPSSRWVALILAVLPVVAGCGSSITTDVPAAFAPSVLQTDTQVTAQEAFNRVRTPLSFDQLRAQLSPADPPFSTDFNPFRQEQDYRRQDGSVVHEVAIYYETPDIPVQVLTEPQIRSGSSADHQSALVAPNGPGTVMELDINIDPGQGLKAPVPFHRGDSLILKGEYIITDPSQLSQIDGKHHNVIHWTHHSGNPNHPGGHVIFRGVTYQ